MSANLLIALATAFGSATIILLAVIGILKVFRPRSFAENIRVVQQANEPVLYLTQASLPRVVIDTGTLSALSGEQIASLVGRHGQLLIAEAVQSETRGRTAPSVVESLRGDQFQRRAFQQVPVQQADEVLHALAGY